MKAIEILQQVFGNVPNYREKCIYNLAGRDDLLLRNAVHLLEREYGVRVHEKEYQTVTHAPIDSLHEFFTKMQHEQAE